MKLSVAIADVHALPSAYVVFRGFEKYIPVAGSLGFDGVELAIKSAKEINAVSLDKLLAKHKLEVSCFSTGQVYADSRLSFTNPDNDRRNALRKVFFEIIDLAADFGRMVNIGRVRGSLYDTEDAGKALELFMQMMNELGNYAAQKNVTLLLEPVNRYEVDFLHSVEDGVLLLQKLKLKNVKLMPDLFHMNIEDKAIGSELSKWINLIGYIHLADSNRLAPGQGHMDFQEIFNHLKNAGYDGWVSLEILPKPTPEIAAKQSTDFLLPMLTEYNNKSTINFHDSTTANKAI